MSIDAIKIAQSGMQASQQLLNVLSHNIANVHTTAFKKSTVHFVNLVQQSNEVNVSGQSGATMHGVVADTQINNFASADLRPSGRELDVAIQGNGFIAVNMPTGEKAYTRGGSLYLDAQGFLTTAQGYRLADNITVPPDAREVVINTDGKVQAIFNNEPELDLGTINLTQFSNVTALSEIETGTYVADLSKTERIEGHPGEDNFGVVAQRFLELSNVDLINELTDIMVAQRGFQMNARILQTADEITEVLTNLSN